MKKKGLFWFLFGIIGFFLWQSNGLLANKNPQPAEVSLNLLSNVSSVHKGEKFYLGFHFKIIKNWHIYWRNGGEVGLPVRIVEVQESGGKSGRLLWPSPLTYKDKANLVSYIYNNEVMLLLPVEADKHKNEYNFTAVVKWLACEDACIPQEKKVSIVLPVIEGKTILSSSAPLIDASLKKLPLNVKNDSLPFYVLAQGWSQELIIGKKADFSAEIALPKLAEINDPLAYQRCRILPFFSQDQDMDPSLMGWKADIGRVGLVRQSVNSYQVRLSVRMTPPVDFAKTQMRAEILCSDWSKRGVEIAVSQSTMKKLPSVSQDESNWVQVVDAQTGVAFSRLLLMAMFAFIGGLILNIMPCVLPVLSIKIFSLVKHAGSESKIIVRTSLVFVAGMVATFLALALAVIIVKGVGKTIGWGFQFQNPFFILFLILIVFIFALSFFNVYAFNVPQTGKLGNLAYKEGLTGSFFQGVLATILATPCSAPFLGSAMAFAFSQGNVVILFLFLMVGLGMAAPYFLLALKPEWIRFIPKPGEWMENFKQFMGILLMATVVWLITVLGTTLGAEAVNTLLFYLIGIGTLVWLAGRLAPLGVSRRRFFMVWGIIAGLIVLITYLVFPAMVKSGKETVAQAKKQTAFAQEKTNDKNEKKVSWPFYTAKAVAEAKSRGQIVFIKFTADWCLTCKFNEKTILSRENITNVFLKHKVATFSADWTDGNETVGKLLKSYNRSGVPIYVIISSNANTPPIILPEVITTNMVIEAIEKAAQQK